MSSTLQPLLDQAFDRAKAVDANVEIARIREAQKQGLEEALSYEVVLDEVTGMAKVLDIVLPRLVYFLDCRGLKLELARGVFVSAFLGDTLYFIHASDFVGAAAKVAGLGLDELVKRYGAASV